MTMKTMRRKIENAAVGVGVANRLDDLSAIHHPGCAAVIWRRDMPATVGDTFAAMETDRLPCARIILRPDAVRETMAVLCDDTDAQDGDAMAWLVEDVAALADRFTALTGAPHLRLRLEIVTGDSCRKFHVDSVLARLICTYRGTGTQYGVSTDGAEPARVFTVPTGAPVLLRGTLWPGDAPSGLLHRSPPITGTGETRLLLVLDPIFDLEDEF